MVRPHFCERLSNTTQRRPNTQLGTFMMKTIFDRETEIGKCDYEETDHFQYAEPHYTTLYGHTLASLNNKGLLKIEQHCYLRNGADLPDQPWVRPQIILEPAAGTEEEMIKAVEQLHRQFIERTRKQFPEQHLV